MNELEKVAILRSVEVCPYRKYTHCSLNADCYCVGCQWGVATINIRNTNNASFKLGAQWQAKQSPWISVEDAIPKESAKGLAKVKYLDGSEGEMLMGHVSKWVYPYIKTGYITHWMPIPE